MSTSIALWAVVAPNGHPVIGTFDHTRKDAAYRYTLCSAVSAEEWDTHWDEKEAQGYEVQPFTLTPGHSTTTTTCNDPLASKRRDAGLKAEALEELGDKHGWCFILGDELHEAIAEYRQQDNCDEVHALKPPGSVPVADRYRPPIRTPPPPDKADTEEISDRLSRQVIELEERIDKMKAKEDAVCEYFTTFADGFLFTLVERDARMKAEALEELIRRVSGQPRATEIAGEMADEYRIKADKYRREGEDYKRRSEELQQRIDEYDRMIDEHNQKSKGVPREKGNDE